MTSAKEEMYYQCTQAFEMLMSLAKITHTILARCGLNSHHGGMLIHVGMNKHGITQKELAQRLAVRPSSITSMLDTLEREGLVCRQTDENDKRVKHISLTKKGKALSSRFLEQLAELNSQFFTNFSPQEYTAFWNYVCMIKTNMLSILNQMQCPEEIPCTYIKED